MYIEYFYFNDKKYKIDFPKNIPMKSVFLRSKYDDDFNNDYFLTNQHTNIPIFTNSIIKSLFDIDFYVDGIKLILEYVNITDNYSDEMLLLDPLKKDSNNLMEAEKKLLKSLVSLSNKIKRKTGNVELLYKILHTHYAMYQFFKYFEITTNIKESGYDELPITKNIGILILGEFFSIWLNNVKSKELFLYLGI